MIKRNYLFSFEFNCNKNKHYAFNGREEYPFNCKIKFESHYRCSEHLLVTGLNGCSK